MNAKRFFKYTVIGLALVMMMTLIFVMGFSGKSAPSFFGTGAPIAAEAATSDTVSDFIYEGGRDYYYKTLNMANESFSFSRNASGGWFSTSTVGPETNSKTLTVSFGGVLKEAMAKSRIKLSLRMNYSYTESGWGDSHSEEGSISVSGGASGGVSFTSNTSSSLFTDLATCDGTAITITLSGTGQARDKSTVGGSSCGFNINITLTSVWLDIYFVDEIPVTFDKNGSGAGTISNTATTLKKFTDTATSTAAAEDGSYLAYWTNPDGNQLYTNKVTTPQNYTMYSGRQRYTATFNAIGGSYGTSYIYNRAAQGPAADGISGYVVSHSYVGTGQTSYNSSQKPTNAGTYRYVATVRRTSGGDVLGTKTVDFEIAKETLLYDYRNPDAILFGKPLSDTNVSITNIRAEHNTGVSVAGALTWSNAMNASTLLNVGEQTYTFTFTPNDSNYVAFSRDFTFTINRGFSVETTPYGIDNNRNGISYTTRVTDNKAQVVLTATPYKERNFIFLGFRKFGGAYTDVVHNFSDNTGVFTMDSSDGSINARLQAVFLQYYISDENLSDPKNAILRNYNGGRHEIAVSFFNNVATSEYSVSSISWNTSDGAAPTYVGNYVASFSINNTALNTQAALTEISVEVKKVSVVAASDVNSLGYNVDNGWAQSMTYNLSVPNVFAGAVTGYYYSLDGGITYIKINGTPQNEPNCRMTFQMPDIPVNTSRIYSLKFKAVNSAFSNETAIAEMDVPVICKLDRITPTISVKPQEGLASGVFANRDFVFDVTVTAGGSGFKFWYKNGEFPVDSQIYDFVSFDARPSDLSAPETKVLTFTLTEEQVNDYVFSVTGATGLSANLDTVFTVKIDKRAPIVSYNGMDKVANSNGWVNETAIGSITATDNHSGIINSGIVSVTVDNNGVITPDSGILDKFSNTLSLTIPDNRVYTVTVRDEAGNETTVVIKENIDIITPDYTLGEGSYTANTWVNISALFSFNISAGGSGIRMSFSTNGSDFSYFGDDAFIKEVGGENNHLQYFNLSYSFDEDRETEYWFKIESASGLTTIKHFGYVKIDKTRPRFTDINSANFLNYVYKVDGDNNWRSETINFRFNAEDNAGTINSGINSVTVDSGATVLTLTPDGNVYSFDLKSCVEHTVTVRDNAGNEFVKTYRYAVDQGELEASVSAFIGNTAENYDFGQDSWLSYVLYGDNAFVKFVIDVTFSPSGARLEWSMNGTNWTALTGYLFEEGNEYGMVQRINGLEVDIKNEQDNPFFLRMTSGSGKTVSFGEQGYIRIDFTAPRPTQQTYADAQTGIAISRTNLDNVWRYNAVRVVYYVAESMSGVKTHEIRKYAFDTDNNDFDTASYEVIPHTTDGNSHSFIMDGYSKYVYYLEDNAGNVLYTNLTNADIRQAAVILPRIDQTDNFTLSVTQKLSSGADYVSGEWIYDESVSVRFNFGINLLNGASAFGASGGRVEYSINGGNTYNVSFTVDGGAQAITGNSEFELFSPVGSPYLDVTAPQTNDYKFRVITGAGKVYEYGGEISVNKNIIAPNISVNARASSQEYDSSWIRDNLAVTLGFDVGPGGARLYYAVSDTGDYQNASFTFLQEYNRRNNNSYIQNIINTVDNKYYFYKLVNGDGREYVTPGLVVKIDKEAVSANVSVTSGDYAYGGRWTYGTVKFAVKDIPALPSGYTVYYETSEINGATWGNRQQLTASNGELVISENTAADYRFIIVSGSGNEFITTGSTVRLDNVKPEFTITASGRRITEAGDNYNWYTAAPTISVNTTNYGASGFTIQFAHSNSIDGTFVFGTEGLINNGVTLYDTSSVGGGTVHYALFRIISGSGLLSDEKDGDGNVYKAYTNNELTATNTISPVKVDTASYSVRVANKVANVESGNYASVSGIGSAFLRGETTTVEVNAYSGYSVKSFDKNGFTNINNETQTDSSVKFSVTISGESVSVSVDFYKDIEVEYSNTSQFMQGREITPIGITITEVGFTEIYGELGFDVTYDGDGVLPSDIGVYNISVSPAGEYADSFRLLNSTSTLTVVYFEDLIDYFAIKDYKDISYIDIYMSKNSEYNYLGQERFAKEYRQMNDIELPSEFAPIERFTAIYNGGCYRVYYDGTFTAESENGFGFFKNLDGAEIRNLGIEFSVIANKDNFSVGLLAANVYNGASIEQSYAIGSIEVNGTSVNVGGIIGKIDDGQVGLCVSDVKISGSVSGNVGGIIGYQGEGDLIFIGNYSVSVISLTESTASVGAIIGFVRGQAIFSVNDDFGTNVSLPNYFNSRSITVNYQYRDDIKGNLGSIGIGNAQASNEYVVATDFDTLLADTTEISGFGLSDTTVGEILSKRARVMGIGRGISGEPIEVSEENDLKLLALFPWAEFKQTRDISLSGGIMLSYESVFFGIYDGGDYILSGNTLTSNGMYTGLFAIICGEIKNLKIRDISYSVTASGDSYVGGVAAVAAPDSKLNNIEVSGTIIINGGESVYAGALAAAAGDALISNIVSYLSLNVNGAERATVGGIIGSAEGDETALNNLYGVSKVSVNYKYTGAAGGIAGAIYNGVTGERIYAVDNNVYINGRLYSGIASVVETSALTVYDLLSFANMLNLIDNNNVQEVFPFSGGLGTAENPFIISNYNELLRIKDYMYAAFKLTSDITVGDFDNDGEIDADYKYDFEPIGGSNVFTGVLDGQNHSIHNLTDSLFETNNGSIRNITLNVYYTVYDDAALAGADVRAKLVSSDESVVFGAAAKYNNENGNLREVIVSGRISVMLKGRGRVKVGGVVGVVNGGRIAAIVNSAPITVNALNYEVGGIIGAIEGASEINYTPLAVEVSITIANIYAYGSSNNAGIIVGTVKDRDANIIITFEPEAHTHINGVDYGTSRYVGFGINGFEVIVDF